MKHTPSLLTTHEHIARYYSRIAIRSLYEELALYPKPGLVSFVDSGAHRDMNALHFMKSLFHLRHFFYDVSLASLENLPKEALVSIGKKYEIAMMKTTGGINTHRGAIFSLGICCSALSKLHISDTKLTTNQLREAIIKEWSWYLQNQHIREKSCRNQLNSNTYTCDALQNAIEGYTIIFNLFHEICAIKNPTQFGITAYCLLINRIDDTNIINRTGIKGLSFARNLVNKAFFKNDYGKTLRNLTKTHKIFSKKNISPGGVADMIALLYFFRRIFVGNN